VIIQVSSASTPGASLLTESSTSSATGQSFDHYLEEEQKRLGLAFAGLGKFDFSSLFNYSSLSWLTEITAKPLQFFSDLEMANADSPSTPATESTAPLKFTANRAALAAPSSSPTDLSRTMQKTLQEILLKTGWLVPNLESQPFFQQAQLANKLLSKLDLQSLVDQIVAQLKLVKDKGQVELTLGLKPSDLGEILLTLTTRSGAVAVNIQASAETRRLLDEQLSELVAALKKAHINLVEIKIEELKEANNHA
jgi:flagellar hook-length control protein FliK